MNKGVVIVHSLHCFSLTYVQAMIRGRIIFEEGGNDMNQPMLKLIIYLQVMEEGSSFRSEDNGS